MAKNNKFINELKFVQQKINDTLPNMYASIAIALWKSLDAPDEEKVEIIEDIFAQSQEIWQHYADKNESIVSVCKAVTGIDLKYQ